MHSLYEAVSMKSNNHYLSKFVILDLKIKNETKEMLDYSKSKIYDTPYYRRQFFVTRTPNKIYER